MREQAKTWIPVICVVITIASITWATSSDRTAAWAEIKNNSAQISELKKNLEIINQIREDVAVIKNVIQRYERQERMNSR